MRVGLGMQLIVQLRGYKPPLNNNNNNNNDVVKVEVVKNGCNYPSKEP